MCCAAAGVEATHQAFELDSLARQALRGGVGLFHHRRILLRCLVHLVDRCVDLLEPRRLLICSGGY